MVILAICGHSIGMFCGILFADASKVTVMIPMMMVPLMLFSGVFNNLNDIPKWISWLQYLTPFKYGTHVLLLNEYGDEEYQVAGDFTYDYKQLIGIDLTFWQNIGALFGISLFFLYYCSAAIKKIKFKDNNMKF